MAFLFCKCSLKPIFITQSEDYCFDSFLLTLNQYTTNSVTTEIYLQAKKEFCEES